MKSGIMAAVLAATLVAAGIKAQSTATAADGTTVRADTVTVLPGDPRLEAERLVPRRVTWRVTVENPDGSSTVQGLWTDTWVRTREEGRDVMIFRTLFADTTGAILVDNETAFDAESFRGLRLRQRIEPAGTRVSYEYRGDTVSGTLLPSAGAEQLDFEVVFEEPVWEPLAPVLLLVPLERLEPGTVVRFPVWDQRPGDNDVTWNFARVDSVGEGRLPDGSGIDGIHVTLTFAAAPGAVWRLWMGTGPVFARWFRVERPSLTREWMLVDWQPLTFQSW